MSLNVAVQMDPIERINIGFSISPALMSGQVDGVIGAFRNFELNQLALEIGLAEVDRDAQRAGTTYSVRKDGAATALTTAHPAPAG